MTSLVRYITFAAILYFLAGLIVSTVGPAGKEIWSEFAKLRKGTPPELAKLGLTNTPRAPLWKCLVFAGISSATATILWPAFWDKIFPPNPKTPTPHMPLEWLIERTTENEAESKNMVRVEKLGPEPIPFGYQNGHWQEFLSTMEPGDELWNYSSPPESWKNLAGRAGIALVRRGKIIANITTLMN